MTERARALAVAADDLQRRRRWLAIPVAVFRKFKDDRGDHWAALVALYGFLSLFPLLLAFVTVLGFAIHDNPAMQRQVVRSALAQFPIIGTQIERNVQALSGSAVTLVLGLVAAIWSGMRVITALQGAMDELWNVPRQRHPGFMRSRLRALAWLLALGSSTLLGGVLAGFGAASDTAGLAMRGLAFVATAVLNVALFASMFRLLTVAPVRWRDVMPGALLGAAAWMGLLVAGSWIVDRQIRNATEVYGFFAVVIGLLAWLALGAHVTLLAAETNVVLRDRLWPRSLVERRRTTDPDRRSLAGEAQEEQARPEESIDVRFGGAGPERDDPAA